MRELIFFAVGIIVGFAGGWYVRKKNGAKIDREATEARADYEAALSKAKLELAEWKAKFEVLAK